MNGLISDPESRNTHPTKKNKPAAAAVVGGAFLFLGFVLGFESSPISTSFAFNFPKPTLEKQILDFSKISWFADEIESKKISVQPQAIEDLNVNINFNAFTLPRARVIGYNKITTKIKHKTISTPWRVLAKTNISRDVKDEYIIAAAKLRTQFFSAVYIKPLSNDELFAMNLLQPSELPKSDVEVALREIVELKAKNIAPVTTSLPTPIKFHSILMAKKSKVSTPKNIRSKNNLVETSQPVIEAPLMDAEIVGVEYTKQPEESLVTVLSTHEDEMSIQVSKSSAEQTPTIPNLELASESLSNDEKNKLSEAMMNEQLNNIVINQKQKYSSTPKINNGSVAHNNRYAQVAPPRKPPSGPDVVEEEDKTVAHAKSPGAGIIHCDTLSSHEFIMPGSVAIEDTQICPERKTWISKNNIGLSRNEGWVRLESKDNFSTLTRHPSANGGPTLLLDQNSIALMAVTSGVRIVKGAGIVAGHVPSGFRVELLGHREPEYFILNNKRYFAFLNAVPGPGIIEITSEKDQTLSSTVFTPVLEDTITYLDLAKPEVKNILVQVVKSGQPGDPEVMGLAVGLSTHGGISSDNGIQAITQSQGHAALKNVNIVPGFPVFIDVASKWVTEKSYTYRYELKHKNQFGVYVVNQVNEKNIGKWTKQISHGLSSQSAMVLGYFDRHKLNGFKNEYYPKSVPLTEKYGLEVLNFTILWDGKISSTEPLEGDKPRFMSVQVPEGITQIKLINEHNQEIYSNVIPVSPRIINVISE